MIVILIKHKHKCIPTCDGINCSDGYGGTCKCTTYTSEPNPRVPKTTACFKGKQVEELCNVNDDCKAQVVVKTQLKKNMC